MTWTHDDITRITEALAAAPATVRLRAAMAAGTRPDPRLIGPLIRRCGVEPDFHVRDTLTWALTRNDRRPVTDAVVAELGASGAQARSQALHTLSKLADPATWPYVTDGLLTDADDEVARSAWRAAAVLVPATDVGRLADTLAALFGRGDTATKRSLSRAFVGLGDGARAAVQAATATPDPERRAHAAATVRLMDDPESEFVLDVDEARRHSHLRVLPPNGEGRQCESVKWLDAPG